jgi:hypothetical protein
MLYRGTNWEATLPVDDLFEPVIYFTQMNDGAPHAANGTEKPGRGGSESISPMRITIPVLLGMEMPSHPFYPFIEGFEEGLHRWEIIGATPAGSELQIVPLPHQGKAALQVRIPGPGDSLTIATTRIRGRQFVDHYATGIQLWLRAREGSGRVHFTLFANAHGTNQISVTANLPDPVIGIQWRKFELPLESFPGVPMQDIDWFAIELIGTPDATFLLDDLSLMGPWTLPGD